MNRNAYPGKPDVSEFRAELLRRKKKKQRLGTFFRSLFYILVASALVCVLVVTVQMPVLRIYGSSMTPTLGEGDVVVTYPNKEKPEPGDIVCIRIGTKLLIKRVIAGPGDTVDIDEKGNVSVNGEILPEPYATERSAGRCEVELPCRVPEDSYFVLGDCRAVASDSRNAVVGCVESGQIVGEVRLRVWPLRDFGWIG